jgi:hypothetical protein|tara:strand:+ start:831 stop:980 length:150 start_codon:yes stop_codon:yes gene_type:complete
MTYNGYEIYDEREVGCGFRVSYRGWLYNFDTLEEAQQFIRDQGFAIQQF